MRKHLFLGFAALFFSLTLVGQEYELQSSTETYKDLLKLHRGLRVLYVAAHPDDENTRLIAWLENEKNIETVYLSLTRGQGGQNLIGDEKGDALGVIRTYELLEARKIDGGEQMFTRAVDFGYSKSAEESFSKWGKEEVLADVVYAIRKFRPHIIITRFPPNRNAGHGHHEASALLAAEAFDLASEKSAFPDQFDRVEPWTPQAMYFNSSSWWRKELEDKTDLELKDENIIRVNIGTLDPITGMEMNEIASLARSKHRCQAFGTSRDRGERFEYLELLKGEWRDDLFDSYEGVWSRSEGHKSSIQSIIDQYNFTDPMSNYKLFINEVEPKLAQRSMWADGKDINYVNQLSAKIKRNMLGVRVEAYAGQDPIVVESEFDLNIEVYNGGSEALQIRFNQPEIDTSFEIGSGKQISFIRKLNAPKEPSTPYWLRLPHDELYEIEDPNWQGEPRLRDKMIEYTVKFDVPFKGETELHRKWTDRSVGEILQPIQYVPLVSITNQSNTLLIKNDGEVMQHIEVLAFGSVKDLRVSPSGVEVDATARTGIMLEKGQKTTVSTKWQSGSEPNEKHNIRSSAYLGDLAFHQSVQAIEYDHIPNILIAKDCEMTLVKLDLKMQAAKILYIEGSGDEVDEALENIGYEIDRTPLSEVADKLNDYKAIVVGIRAYNTNDQLIAYQDKLMNYVENGGNMIVQYNTSRGLKLDEFGPYPFQLGRERVTEEDAEAILLQPKHQVFSKPNKIESSDFDGWVQERGLYFASEWGDEYTPLISWKDSGEEKISDGGLIVSQYGKGSFFYSGISFFRQLPAGVSGAYRLLVNMIEYQPK